MLTKLSFVKVNRQKKRKTHDSLDTVFGSVKKISLFIMDFPIIFNNNWGHLFKAFEH